MKPKPNAAELQRRKELARIHILKKDLALTDEQYQGVILTIGQKSSAGELDSFKRAEVIKHLVGRLPAKKRQFRKRPHNTDTPDRRELTKIEALLADAGRDWAYAAKMAKHMYRKEALEFCSQNQLAGIVAALDKDAIKRLGVALEKEWGPSWRYRAQVCCEHLFSLSPRQRADASSLHLSLALRWWRGEVEASCQWPVNLQDPLKVCGGCYHKNRHRLIAEAGA